MSKRSEIIDGYKASTANRGLIYTEVLGWIDLGHARGDDVKKLMGKLREGEASGKSIMMLNTSSQCWRAAFFVLESILNGA